jgi:hypothetical protein
MRLSTRAKLLRPEQLRQAAYRLCVFVRCARLPLAVAVLSNLLDDVGIHVSARQLTAICRALERQGHLQISTGRIPRYGLGASAAQSIDGEALAHHVEVELASPESSVRKATPARFVRVSSVFDLGRHCTQQERAGDNET